MVSMGENNRFKNNEDFIVISKENKNFFVKTRYPISKFVKLLKNMRVINVNYKFLLSEFLEVKTDRPLTVSEIYDKTDVLQEYIKLSLEKDPYLEDIYKKIITDDVFEKYVKALTSFEYKGYIDGDNIIKSLSQNMVKLPNVFFNERKTIQHINKLLIGLGAANKNVSELFDSLKKLWVDQLRILPESILSIEERETLQSNSEKLGKYGWCLPPGASIIEFSQCPRTRKEANSIVRPFIRNVENIFGLCKNLISSDIIDEAKFNFENRKYRACAVLLVAEIDGLLIRCQKNSNKKVGKKAVDEFERMISADKAIETILRNINLISSLNIIFESANNFIQKPSDLNRNYLMHGMYNKKVIRQDCVKLLLTIYNLSRTLENIKE